jgi:hypothetical protein
MIHDVNTIQDTYERAKAEGIGVSMNFIRRMCLEGKLKHCRSGNKILIFYPNLLDLLRNGMETAETEPKNQKYGEIRQLPVR